MMDQIYYIMRIMVMNKKSELFNLLTNLEICYSSFVKQHLRYCLPM